MCGRDFHAQHPNMVSKCFVRFAMANSLQTGLSRTAVSNLAARGCGPVQGFVQPRDMFSFLCMYSIMTFSLNFDNQQTFVRKTLVDGS